MSGDAGRRAVRLRVQGRVQGVWFRGWTRSEATRLGLAGWVRNRSDGSVEILVIGPPAAVEAMVRACHSGPSHARVDHVIIEEAVAEDCDSVNFIQCPTV